MWRTSRTAPISWSRPGSGAAAPSGPARERPPRFRSRRGQTIIEFALVYGAILLPLTFMFVFACELMWVWHSVAEWTRAGANYAATHCFQSDGTNVKQWMRANVPLMIDINRFSQGEVDVNVDYFSEDPTSGQPVGFACAGAECSPECIPDLVRITIGNYTFRRFLDVLGLPGVPLPDFSTAVRMEGAGCNPESNTCLP